MNILMYTQSDFDETMWWVNRFLLSGADVISTATYQASLEGFTRHLHVSSERANDLIMSAVQLAKEAVKTFVSETHPSTSVQSGL